MAPCLLKAFLLVYAIFFTGTWALNSTSASSPTTTLLDAHLASIRSVCKSTPYPDACFDSLKLSISIDINPNIINFVLQSLETAFSEGGKLLDLLLNIGSSGVVENQRGAIQDCQELHQITMNSLQRSMSRISSSADSRKLSDARAFLSAALTNKDTCLEGLDSATGLLKPVLVDSVVNTYKYISNSLSMLPNPAVPQLKTKGGANRRLMGFPAWTSRKDRRVLQSFDGGYNPNDVLTVAKDGSGNFTTITDAINFAPNNSYDRTIIYVTQGVYQENVYIPRHKTNIVLLGDGADVTEITGSRSVGDGWTTFRSATVAVSGDGFLARDIAFTNTAGPGKHQAVALRVSADLSAVYLCKITGYQDTLYVHSFRQFYRECDISGTVDFIFGNAAVVFQGCNMIARLPMPGQFNVVTAQSRDTPDEDTGISIQNCSIIASQDLSSNMATVKTYLGRPWRPYSRTVYMDSYLDNLIDSIGWTQWSDDQGLDTLYYGEYQNTGPGSATDGRVTWPGYHIMNYDDAWNFTVSQFITGDEWLDSTSFPYDNGV
uniref:Pectinesterase n=1 Tax=Nelumbo nucifera TaxID=4432 RepID=A0A822ZXG5_NELNU|nr:TPA_asm: hypothetical protein HUJ06_019137 [Nelumbo nucifera]